MADINKNWTTIIVSIITILGSIIAAIITSTSTTKDKIDEVAQNFKPIHLESGLVEVEGENTGLNAIPKNLSKKNITSRKFVSHIDFDKPFGFTPVVRTSFTAIDVDKNENLRLLIYPTAITNKGFDIVAQTWSDTKINYINLTWFAYQLP